MYIYCINGYALYHGVYLFDRKIVRKCEQLEYRIHKRVKHIEDFESYIEVNKVVL